MHIGKKQSIIQLILRLGEKERKMPKSNSKIQHIWSESFWEEEAERIELSYWGIICDRIPHSPPPPQLEETEHRIEAFVRKMARKHSEGNLHIGMTSSDLEDNIRIKRIEESLEIAKEELDKFYYLLSVLTQDHKKLIAYTHLVPAGITTISQRINVVIHAHLDTQQPRIFYRGIRGALGDMAIQRRLGISEKELDTVFRGKTFQRSASQTVNHSTESEVAQWLSREASLLAKLANDFRMMFALGQAHHTHDDVGSTAIAGKKPNPWRYERASSMSKLLFDLPSKIATITADCLLERTLTNQSVLNYLFEHAFPVFIDIIEDMKKAMSNTEIVDQTAQCNGTYYHTEEILLELVLSGMVREQAHATIRRKFKNH